MYCSREIDFDSDNVAYINCACMLVHIFSRYILGFIIPPLHGGWGQRLPVLACVVPYVHTRTPFLGAPSRTRRYIAGTGVIPGANIVALVLTVGMFLTVTIASRCVRACVRASGVAAV